MKKLLEIVTTRLIIKKHATIMPTRLREKPLELHGVPAIGDGISSKSHEKSLVRMRR